MWTIDKVIDELNKLAITDGLGHVNVPITANSRLTTTLGRVKYMCIGKELYIAKSIEFSQKLLETGTDNDIINVIKHEYVHYFLIETTNVNHGHDAMFKRKCAHIGCTHDKTRNKLESDTFSIERDQTKYEVWCEDCQAIVGQYHRMCKTLRTLDYCKCGRCNGTTLKMIQNW